MGTKKQTLSRRVAQSLADQHSSVTHVVCLDHFRVIYEIALKKAKRLRPESLGRIAAEHVASNDYLSIYRDHWIAKGGDTGRCMLRNIAATHIAAEWCVIQKEVLEQQMVVLEQRRKALQRTAA